MGNDTHVTDVGGPVHEGPNLVCAIVSIVERGGRAGAVAAYRSQQQSDVHRPCCTRIPCGIRVHTRRSQVRHGVGAVLLILLRARSV